MPWGKARPRQALFTRWGKLLTTAAGQMGLPAPRPHVWPMPSPAQALWKGLCQGWCWARSCPARDKCVPSVNGSSFWKSCRRECLAANRSFPTEPYVTHPGRQPASRGQEGICPQGSQRGAGDSGPHLGLISSPPHSLLSYSVSSSTYFTFYPGLERNSVPAVWGTAPERLGNPQTH